MGNSMGVLSVFSEEKQVFQRELKAGYYSLPAYFFTKVAVELPFQILMPIIMVSIMYFMIGLQKTALKYVIATGFTVLLALCGSAIGMLAACAFDNLAVALMLVPLILLPLMLFSGFFLNTANIPEFCRWIKHLSPIKYGFVGLAKNEFSGLVVCKPDANGTCINGNDVLSKQFNFDTEGTIEENFGILCGIWLLLIILSYLSLWRIVRGAKRVDFAKPSSRSRSPSQQPDGNVELREVTVK
jgi:hypothetical protein